MSYLVFALGLLLAIFGAAAISFGYGIIDVERGWANVISGAVALSGGIVTIALAMILHSLSGLRPLLKAERARAAAVDAPAEALAPIVAQAGPLAIQPSLGDAPGVEDPAALIAAQPAQAATSLAALRPSLLRQPRLRSPLLRPPPPSRAGGQKRLRAPGRRSKISVGSSHRRSNARRRSAAPRARRPRRRKPKRRRRNRYPHRGAGRGLPLACRARLTLKTSHRSISAPPRPRPRSAPVAEQATERAVPQPAAESARLPQRGQGRPQRQTAGDPAGPRRRQVQCHRPL